MEVGRQATANQARHSRNGSRDLGGFSYSCRMPPNTILEVAAARPNFMKIAPIHRALIQSGTLRPILVHTGQHYDRTMSDVFFKDLGLADADIRLETGSGTHAQQTARVLMDIEPYLLDLRPAAVVVVGDVNSTVAAALCAAKLGIPVVHVEAGLRSFRRDMPEEVNRVVTDSIADLLLAPSKDAVVNLRREGHRDETIHMVGNVMIDSLDLILPKALQSNILETMGLRPESYFVATIHRPSNVDNEGDLDSLIDILLAASEICPLVFAVHPRTMAMLRAHARQTHLESGNVIIRESMGYIDFLGLLASSSAVLTDSGGIQEESTVLGVPCLTLRDETERPVTVTHGTNHVVGRDRERILSTLRNVGSMDRRSRRPPFWDGHAADRIVSLLETTFG
jgi:UDP-N-acetylglucosamine 2-epimerase (non-hydrolysing)